MIITKKKEDNTLGKKSNGYNQKADKRRKLNKRCLTSLVISDMQIKSALQL